MIAQQKHTQDFWTSEIWFLLLFSSTTSKKWPIPTHWKTSLLTVPNYLLPPLPTELQFHVSFAFRINFPLHCVFNGKIFLTQIRIQFVYARNEILYWHFQASNQLQIFRAVTSFCPCNKAHRSAKPLKSLQHVACIVCQWWTVTVKSWTSSHNHRSSTSWAHTYVN